MAIAKDIPEIYVCETDADRESITPYAGQKCIMQNGDIYACFKAGVWGKIGEEPIPPIPPTSMLPFTINTSGLIEANDNGWFNNADSLDLVIGNSYKLSFVTDDNSYDIITTAESVPSFDTLITLNFDIKYDSPFKFNKLINLSFLFNILVSLKNNSDVNFPSKYIMLPKPNFLF